jgi:hypothetical protein
MKFETVENISKQLQYPKRWQQMSDHTDIKVSWPKLFGRILTRNSAADG